MIADAPLTKRLFRLPASLSVMGVPVTPFESYDHALECITQAIESGRKSSCVAINPLKIHRAWREPSLLDILREMEYSICDGIGVSIAARILCGQGLNRITGCDLFFRLLSLAAEKQWGVYLLGASAQSNAAACARLPEMYPGLRIVGGQDGYFTDPGDAVRRINASRADLLFVAMGSPKQEYWIAQHRHAIDARFCMGVGGSIDIAAGHLRRAPAVFRMTGTEFLFRFALEPRKRLAHQGILLRFLLRVIGTRLCNAGPSRVRAREANTES
ncbi:MAG: WecB/TagA/CpsF family glycosyltransferase [Planctomycetes bacterium]|nr:WecB/TagA/CpsF family glycosyltransferase [Planctomycetota bacterium]